MSLTETAGINARIDRAVVRHRGLSKAGLLERGFSTAFRGLVYPQIWEDPLIDMEALNLGRADHVVAIASGSCNVMSYLTANPASITAVDLSPAHIALGKLKLAAARHLPDHTAFSNFFRHADMKSNMRLYERFIREGLDDESRSYWEGRDISGRRRISRFARGFYRTGLLGRFIAAAHVIGRIYGVDPRRLLAARTLEEQRAFFDEQIAPIFERRSFRALIGLKASLFGLGIPPAQYDALAADNDDGMVQALKIRTERLACGYPIKDNYFAWQAFGRSYGPGIEASLPPYLERQNFETIRANADRVEILNESVTDLLANKPEGSVDAFVLLDAQDWMTPCQLCELWAQITRTAAPGARVIYRTAAALSPLPNHVPAALLERWDYREAQSRELVSRDRSAIYGGFHLHVLKDEKEPRG